MRIAVVFGGEQRSDEMDVEVFATWQRSVHEHIAQCRFVNLPASVRAKILTGAETRVFG
jgi:hypothetical protein